jgi:hypothetical protein
MCNSNINFKNKFQKFLNGNMNIYFTVAQIQMILITLTLKDFDDEAITVTIQLINILSFFLFTTYFGLSRPSSGVSLYAKTVTLYWIIILFV